MKKGKEENVLIKVPELNKKVLDIKIKGLTPLIMHKFGAKAQKQIEDIQKGHKKKRGTRDPEAEYLDCLHIIEKHKNIEKIGFPASGFHLGMIRCSKSFGITMVDAKGYFKVFGKELPSLINISGDYKMRTDMVRVGNGAADIRYRPEFLEWEANILVNYDPDLIDNASIVNLINHAGDKCGIGEWRPSSPFKPGTFGMYEVKR